MHGDIKAANVLLSGLRNTVKLGDFGVACSVAHAEELREGSTAVGTPMYMAPEVVQEEAYDCKADVWSTACLLYSLCTLRMPFESIDSAKLKYYIINKEASQLPDQYSIELRNLLHLMLLKSREERVSARAVIELVPAALRRHFMCAEDKVPSRAMMLTVLTYSSRSPPISCARYQSHKSSEPQIIRAQSYYRY